MGGALPANSFEEAYADVARKVLSESLRLKAGETITIETWTAGLPLASEVALQARKLGAYPLITFEEEENYVEAVRSAPKDFVGKMGKHEFGLLSSSDAYVFIPGPPISGYYPKITRQEFIDSTGYNESWYEAAKKAGLRGARITSGYIGKDVARLLGKDRDDIVLHQLRAAAADLPKLKAKARSLENALADGAEAKLLTDGGELTMKLRGSVEIQDGMTDAEDVAAGENMSYLPPGYISKDVDAGSVDGTLALSQSLTRFGLLEDAEVVFRDGKFVKWGSKKSGKVLKAIEGVLPEKSRVPGYLILGLNPLMKFGYGQDRFPEGAVTVGIGINGAVRKGTLSVGGKILVKEGRLQ